MAFKDDLQDVVERVELMQAEAIAGSRAFDNSFMRDQKNNLTWNTRLGGMSEPTPTPYGESIYAVTASLIMTFRAGWVTQGKTLGNLEHKLNYVFVPDVIEYFMSRQNLKHEEGAASINGLDPMGLSITNTDNALSGVAGMPDSAQQFTASFVLSVPMVQRFNTQWF